MNFKRFSRLHTLIKDYNQLEELLNDNGHEQHFSKHTGT